MRKTTAVPVRTLLYVEDNPANLELVEQLIARRADLRLLSAADGNLGIEFARTYQPEVILMDINLPGLSGLEALILALVVLPVPFMRSIGKNGHGTGGQA